MSASSPIENFSFSFAPCQTTKMDFSQVKKVPSINLQLHNEWTEILQQLEQNCKAKDSSDEFHSQLFKDLPEISGPSSGEENEIVKFESPARLYRLTSHAGWENQGLGTVRILQDTKKKNIGVDETNSDNNNNVNQINNNNNNKSEDEETKVETSQVRMTMRTKGSLLVILNVRLWKEMKICQKPQGFVFTARSWNVEKQEESWDSFYLKVGTSSTGRLAQVLQPLTLLSLEEKKC